MKNHIYPLLLSILLLVLLFISPAPAQPAGPPKEEDYYRMVTFPIPEEIVLEVGGLEWLDKEKKRLLACTRRGELWVIDNVYNDQPYLAGETKQDEEPQGEPLKYTQMLFGMHEPLGLLVNPGHGFPDGIYAAQRTELTRLADEDGDDRIDLVESFCQGWEVNGNYHEYAFGPKLGPDNQLWITLNRPFGGGQEPTAYWRGWAVKVDAKGKMTPICPGLRSPAGLGPNKEGELFFTDNQGDHVASGKLGHIKPGVFHGQTTGLESAKHPLSNFTPPFEKYPLKGMNWGEAVEQNPMLIAPAVWFPYPEMGRSQTDVITDTTGGKFGPFAGQMFVGDLSNAIVMRVFLEKIDGEYQGACFPFRKDFTPPILRMTWGHDGSLFVGGSSRGWGGGRKPYGLARLAWTGETPFEIHEMRAKPDGFELTFTQPVDPKTAADAASYKFLAYTHKYYDRYGDDRHEQQEIKVLSATVGGDQKSVRLKLESLKPYFIHGLTAAGVLSADQLPLLHPQAYYTLNRIPKE